jgi:cell wall-associated NlpC family hydrolase
MAVLSAAEIYHFARLAGFSPDQAVTMTAVALAESGGNAGAHNPNGENSQGLWQINVAAHTDLAGTNLYDPLTNAQAAFRVSHQGQDISPWTTTHGSHASYVSHRVEAETAARMAGDSAHGVWTGTPGYGHPLAAGGGDGGGLAVSAADMTASAGAATGGGATESFVNAALAQAGDAYVFGAEADPNDPNPTAFDCSELVQWAAARAGIDLQDGSWNQYMELSTQGPPITVEQAMHTRGALLFDFSSAPAAGGGSPSQAHVAISLGDGRTIEAMDDQHGVLTSTASTKRFNYAAVIPGLATAKAPGPSGADAAGPVGAPGAYPPVDTDFDGIVDAIEIRLGTNPMTADSDGDGISDGYEKFRLHTDPTRADSDGDGISDGAELVNGTDPTSADSNNDGRVDGGDTSPDTDQDGLSDMLEKILGTRPDSIDSDGDGVTDLLEYRSGLDPLDPTSNGLTPSTVGSLTSAAESGLDQPSASHRLLPDPLTGF